MPTTPCLVCACAVVFLKPKKMANGNPISVKGIGVRVILKVNRLPCAKVTPVANRVLNSSVQRMR